MRVIVLIAMPAVAIASVAAANDIPSRPLSATAIARRLGVNAPILVSTWPAGFPKTLDWRADHVVAAPDGGVALHISLAPEGAHRPYQGAEIQTVKDSMVWGRVEWKAQLPNAPTGTVAAMFLYKYPFKVPGDRELDFEYVPGDPKTDYPLGTMQMTLHMTPQNGGRAEATSYKIDMPKDCLKSSCGWAIEAQPDQITFQLRERLDGPWSTIAQYSYQRGWDLQAGSSLGGQLTTPRDRFSDPAIWSERPMNAFVSYWMTDDRLGWLGRLDKSELSGGAAPFVVSAMKPMAFDSLPALGPDAWSLAADGRIGIRAIPASRLQPTSVEYRQDAGDWHQLGPAMPGVYEPDSAIAPGSRIELRLVARGPAFPASHYEVVSRASDSKTFGGADQAQPTMPDQPANR